MKVLVTAFKPFNNQNINYSIEVLKFITDVDKMIVDRFLKNLFILLMPVDYKETPSILKISIMKLK